MIGNAVSGVQPTAIVGGPHGELALTGTYVGMYDSTTGTSPTYSLLQLFYPSARLGAPVALRRGDGPLHDLRSAPHPGNRRGAGAVVIAMRSVAVSIAVHAAAVAWLAFGRGGHAPPLRLPTEVVIEVVPPRAVEAPVVEVTFLDEPASAVGSDVAQPPATRPAASQVTVAVAVPGPTAAEETAPVAPPTAGNLSLAMRGADLQVHTVHERPEAPPAPPAPVAPLARPASPDSGEVDPAATHEAFSLQVDRDGTAHVHDTRNLRWVLKLPTTKDLKHQMAAWHEALAEMDHPTPEPTTHDREDAERPIERPMGSIGVTIVKFDATDWLMRSVGQDPYASAKLQQLDATREARAAIGATYRRRQLAHADALMEQNLEAAWVTLHDDAARKQAVYDLWNECDESNAEATRLARRQILAFARTHRFTAAELARLTP